METVHGRFPSVAIPLGVVVTASGTGSEQNSDAVITNEECHVKCDLYGLLPEFSILDPTLTLSVPMKQVLSGAFDSLSHAMETYFGKPDATFISDELNEAVMRNIIRNMRAAMTDPADVEARGELMWASALAENGILKLGKTTDFQCHMIEHQLGAYTDCSHGQGLAVLHPVMYRHLLWDNSAKFARFAQAVWGLDVASVSAGVEDVGAVSDDTEIEISLAEAGINALEEFIKECGLPLTFSEMGITLDEETINAIAESTMIRPGCARQFSPDEIADILRSCE